MKTALSGKQLLSSIVNDIAERKANEKELSIIIPALEDKPLKAVQLCKTAELMWELLHERYNGEL